MTPDQEPAGGMEPPTHAGITRREFATRLTAAALGAVHVLDRVASAAPVGGTAGMKYRELGKTGIAVSEIGFGSHLTRENMKDPEARAGQIRRGLERGINLFDIYDHQYHQFAPMKKLLGPVREDVVISLVSIASPSNWGWLQRMWSDHATTENWRENPLSEVEYALKALGTEVIDLFRLYVPTEDSREAVTSRFETLVRANEQGKIRAVGMVGHDQATLIQLLRTFPELDYLMLPYNFRHKRLSPAGSAPTRPELETEPTAEAWQRGQRDCILVPCPHPEFAGLVRDTGVGLIAMKPFGGGGLLKLARSGAQQENPCPDGVSLPQAALRFILEAPQIACAIPAMNSIAEVDENVGAAQGSGLSEAEARCLQRINDAAEKTGGSYLPSKYQWLEELKV